MVKIKILGHYFGLFFLVFLAIILRLKGLEALSETPYYTFLLPDERLYHDWAVELLDGKGFQTSFEYAPLPAYFMAFIYWLTTIDVENIRMVNIGLNVGACVLIYFASRMIVGKNWALLALALAACSSELLFYSLVPLKTSLSFFLFALLAYLSLLALGRFSWFLYFLMGLVFGLAFAVRPNILILLPVFLPVIIHYNRYAFTRVKKYRVWAVFLLGVVYGVIPFSLHNYYHSGNFPVLPVQSGFLLYSTNNVNNPTPFYRPVSFASSHTSEQAVHFTIEASKREGKRLTTAQASRFWQLEAVKELIKHPDVFLKKAGQKIAMLFSFSENSDHYHLGVIEDLAPYFKNFKLKFWFFILLGYSGLIFGFSQSLAIRTYSFFFLSYSLSLLIYSNGNRFFLPTLVFLIPAATLMIKFLWEKIRSFSFVTIMASLVCFTLLTTLGRVEITGIGDRSKHYNNLAFIHNESGNHEAAQKYWQLSKKREETYSDVAKLFLANVAYQKEGPQGALKMLKSIPDDSFMGWAKYATLGDIYKEHGKTYRAIEMYEKSLQLNNAQVRIREELLGLLFPIDQESAIRYARELRRIRKYYPAP